MSGQDFLESVVMIQGVGRILDDAKGGWSVEKEVVEVTKKSTVRTQKKIISMNTKEIYIHKFIYNFLQSLYIYVYT